jgi:hypothetical protein
VPNNFIFLVLFIGLKALYLQSNNLILKKMITIRPILIETTEESRLLQMSPKGKNYKDLRFVDTEQPIILDSINYKLIFVTRVDDIKLNDTIYSALYGLGKIVHDYGGIDSERNRPLIAKFENSHVLQSYHRNGIWQKGEYEDVSAHNCKKVIEIEQNKISDEYIKQFVQEYNSNNGYVKDFEIENNTIPLFYSE